MRSASAEVNITVYCTALLGYMQDTQLTLFKLVILPYADKSVLLSAGWLGNLGHLTCNNMMKAAQRNHSQCCRASRRCSLYKVKDSDCRHAGYRMSPAAAMSHQHWHSPAHHTADRHSGMQCNQQVVLIIVPLDAPKANECMAF